MQHFLPRILRFLDATALRSALTVSHAWTEPVQQQVRLVLARLSRFNSRVLLLGEGDFSFARAFWLLHGGVCEEIVATAFEDEATLLKRFPSAAANIQFLRDVGVRCCFGVDATQLHLSARELSASDSSGRFREVHFNFPHTGTRDTDSKLLLPLFFRSARDIMCPFGVVSLALVGGEPHYHRTYNYAAASRAARFRLVSRRTWDQDGVYRAHGYEHKVRRLLVPAYSERIRFVQNTKHDRSAVRAYDLLECRFVRVPDDDASFGDGDDLNLHSSDLSEDDECEPDKLAVEMPRPPAVVTPQSAAIAARAVAAFAEREDKPSAGDCKRDAISDAVATESAGSSAPAMRDYSVAHCHVVTKRNPRHTEARIRRAQARVLEAGGALSLTAPFHGPIGQTAARFVWRCALVNAARAHWKPALRQLKWLCEAHADCRRYAWLRVTVARLAGRTRVAHKLRVLTLDEPYLTALRTRGVSTGRSLSGIRAVAELAAKDGVKLSREHTLMPHSSAFGDADRAADVLERALLVAEPASLNVILAAIGTAWLSNTASNADARRLNGVTASDPRTLLAHWTAPMWQELHRDEDFLVADSPPCAAAIAAKLSLPAPAISRSAS